MKMRKTSILLLLVCIACGQAIAGEVLSVDGRSFKGTLRIGMSNLVVKLEDGSEQHVLWERMARAEFRVQAHSGNEQLPGVAITTERLVPLKQSFTDALNGKDGIYVSKEGHKAKARERAYLTDAVSETEPSGQPGWFAGTVTWDLGDAIPSPERQLDAVSIWLWGDDKARGDYAGWLEVGEDVDNLGQIPGSATAINFGELQEEKHQRNGKFNHVLYTFNPGTVVEFRYLRLHAETPQTTWCDSRFLEVDAFVSRLARTNISKSAVVLRSGSVLQGVIKSLDRDSIKLAGSDSDIKISLREVAQIRFQKIPGTFLKTLLEGKTGVLLSNGEFMDGEIQKLEREQVKLNSVLFGIREFKLKRGVLAVVLRNIKAEPLELSVRTVDGSTLLGHRIDSRPGKIQLDAPGAGGFQIDEANVLEIRRMTNVPAATKL